MAYLRNLRTQRGCRLLIEPIGVYPVGDLGSLSYRGRKPMPSILPSGIKPIRHSVKPFSNFTS